MIHSDNTREELVAEIDRLRADLDLALWLHAEAVFFGHGWHSQWMSTRGTVHELTAENERLTQHLSASDGAEREWHNLATNGVTASAKWKGERDALQARIDAAIEVTEEMLSQLVSGPERRDAEAIYEALTGEQPTQG